MGERDIRSEWVRTDLTNMVARYLLPAVESRIGDWRAAASGNFTLSLLEIGVGDGLFIAPTILGLRQGLPDPINYQAIDSNPNTVILAQARGLQAASTENQVSVVVTQADALNASALGYHIALVRQLPATQTASGQGVEESPNGKGMLYAAIKAVGKGGVVMITSDTPPDIEALRHWVGEAKESGIIAEVREITNPSPTRGTFKDTNIFIITT